MFIKSTHLLDMWMALGSLPCTYTYPLSSDPDSLTGFAGAFSLLFRYSFKASALLKYSAHFSLMLTLAFSLGVSSVWKTKPESKTLISDIDIYFEVLPDIICWFTLLHGNEEQKLSILGNPFIYAFFFFLNHWLSHIQGAGDNPKISWGEGGTSDQLIRTYNIIYNNFEFPIRQLSVKQHLTNRNKGKQSSSMQTLKKKLNLTFYHMNEVRNGRLVQMQSFLKVPSSVFYRCLVGQVNGFLKLRHTQTPSNIQTPIS